MNDYSGLVGLAVGLSVIFFWLGQRFNRTDVGMDVQLQQYLADNPTTLLQANEIAAPPTPNFFERVVIPLSQRGLKRLGRLTPAHNVEMTAKRLDTAGRPYGLTIINFLGLQLIVAIVCAPIGFLLFTGLLHQSISVGAIFAIIFGILGFYLPNFWLMAVVRSRKRAILRALPDALDMIVVCTESGQSLDQALHRVGEHWHSPLTDEFNRILTEISLGRTRRQAVTAAAERIQIPEMSNLVAAIIQAEELGASMGKVLRVQADQLRTKRHQRAEELAHQASIKMLFPLVFMIFPAMLAVLIGPAIPLIIKTLGGVSGG